MSIEKKLLSKLDLIIIWTIISIVLSMFFVYQHESAHQKICYYNDGIPMGIEFRFIGGSSFCNNQSNVIHELDSINDIVGYHLAVILAIIIFLGYLLIALRRSENGRN